MFDMYSTNWSWMLRSVGRRSMARTRFLISSS